MFRIVATIVATGLALRIVTPLLLRMFAVSLTNEAYCNIQRRTTPL